MELFLMLQELGIIMIVLTGGPCAGKTEVLERLKRRFGNMIIVVKEVATALFQAGWPAPDPWTPRWQTLLQAGIISGQYRLETEAIAEARKRGIRVIICDRGLLDGAAYLEGGVQEFCERFGVIEEEANMRYRQIFHLVSLSELDEKMYCKLMVSNPHRFEPVEMARQRESALQAAYDKHPNRLILASHIDESAGRIIEMVEYQL